MRQIAKEEIAKALPQIQRDAYIHALSDLQQALRADVTTIVDIALSTGENIFHDARTQQALMKSIYDLIIKNLPTDYTL